MLPPFQVVVHNFLLISLINKLIPEASLPQLLLHHQNFSFVFSWREFIPLKVLTTAPLKIPKAPKTFPILVFSQKISLFLKTKETQVTERKYFSRTLTTRLKLKLKKVLGGKVHQQLCLPRSFRESGSCAKALLISLRTTLSSLKCGRNSDRKCDSTSVWENFFYSPKGGYIGWRFRNS